jgi:hydrogenase maturation protease
LNGKILVAGVGNIFLGDDAFGVEVAQRLAKLALPEGVRVVDFGIRSYDLAYALMDDWDLVILVDALPRGGEPGTVYTMEPDMSASTEAPPSGGFDAHSMNPVAVLQMVSALGGKCAPLLVVGCEPATIEPSEEGDIGLSSPVRAAVDEAVAAIEQLIAGARKAPVVSVEKGEQHVKRMEVG